MLLVLANVDGRQVKCRKVSVKDVPLLNGGTAVLYWFYLEGFLVLHIMVVGYGDLTTVRF